MTTLPEPSPDTGASQAATTAPTRSVQALGDALKQRFPALFTRPERPLKLRIHVDIQARAPGEFSRQELSMFLRRFTNSFAYLEAVARGEQRFDLDGQAVEALTDAHRQAARDELQRRRESHRTRVEAEQSARRDRARLLRDFSQTPLSRANFCALKQVDESALDGLLAQARQEAAEPPPAERSRSRPAPGRRPERPGKHAAPHSRDKR